MEQISSSSMQPQVARSASNEQDQLREAACQFEAIFVRQMLAAARAADFGGDELVSSQGEETFREMRDAHFAELAAQSGMIGLASTIEAQLARLLQDQG